jgi:hypothetical protein
VSIVFDKLAMVKRLEADDAFTRTQAERLAEAVHAAMHEDLVNKADLQATELSLRADIANVSSELKADFADLRADIASVRTDHKTLEVSLRSEMKVMEHALKYWVGSTAVALFLALFTGLGGLITFLLRVYH